MTGLSFHKGKLPPLSDLLDHSLCLWSCKKWDHALAFVYPQKSFSARAVSRSHQRAEHILKNLQQEEEKKRLGREASLITAIPITQEACYEPTCTPNSEPEEEGAFTPFLNGDFMGPGGACHRKRTCFQIKQGWHHVKCPPHLISPSQGEKNAVSKVRVVLSLESSSNLERISLIAGKALVVAQGGWIHHAQASKCIESSLLKMSSSINHF